VEEREIDRRPKLPCRCISFCFFLEVFDDDFCQTNCVLSNPSSKLVVECEKNNISKTKHDQTLDARDMTIGALLAPLNSALLSLAKCSLLSHFSFFVWTGGLFSVLKAYFPLITIYPLFMPLCIFFYFSHKLSGLFLLKSLVFTELRLR